MSTQNFERGLDPKEAMGTGKYSERDKIESWLKTKGLNTIKHYIKESYNNGDFTIDIYGDVDLVGELLDTKKFPDNIRFKKVTGNFWCDGNELTSLKGCPKEVGDSFSCTNNKLTSLEHKPEIIKGIIWF